MTKQLAEVFHPGVFLQKEIVARFASELGWPADEIERVIRGEKHISETLAEHLAIHMGTSVQLWSSLQKQYDDSRKAKK